MKVQGRCRRASTSKWRIVAPCGSPVYSSAEHNPKSYPLRLGALSEPNALGRPAREIWTKRRLAWIARIEGAREAEGQP